MIASLQVRRLHELQRVRDAAVVLVFVDALCVRFLHEQIEIVRAVFREMVLSE